MDPLKINIPTVQKIGYQKYIQSYIPLLRLQPHINLATAQNQTSHSPNNKHFYQQQGEDGRYYCVCKKSYRSLASLRQHMNDQLKRHQCQVCKKRLTRRNLLRRPQIKHFAPLYKCVICPKYFYSPINWMIHHKKHTSQPDTTQNTTCVNEITPQQNPTTYLLEFDI